MTVPTAAGDDAATSVAGVVAAGFGVAGRGAVADGRGGATSAASEADESSLDAIARRTKPTARIVIDTATAPATTKTSFRCGGRRVRRSIITVESARDER